jgi:hypothetical protein
MKAVRMRGHEDFVNGWICIRSIVRSAVCCSTTIRLTRTLLLQHVVGVWIAQKTFSLELSHTCIVDGVDISGEEGTEIAHGRFASCSY